MADPIGPGAAMTAVRLPGERDASDGRIARGMRTRDALLTAVLDLTTESEGPRPTAKAIADAAGVSVRTLYLHFPDLDALFSAAAEVVWQRIFAMHHPIDPGLPLRERIDRFVAQRARIFEATVALRQGVYRFAASDAKVRTLADETRALARTEVGRVFGAELAAHADGELRHDGIAMASSAQGWDILRIDQHLEEPQARAVLALTVRALLEAR